MGRDCEIASESIVLVEAVKARSINRIRSLEDMKVIQEYEQPQLAWEGYKHFHRIDPSLELYVFHTSRTNVDVVEEFFSGVRQGS